MDTLIALVVFAAVPLSVAVWLRGPQQEDKLPAGMRKQLQVQAACE